MVEPPARGALRPSWRSAVLAAAALLVAASGCGASSGGAATSTTAQSVAAGKALRWSACRGSEGPSGFQCATLRVPLDPADPGTATIGIALDRRPASGPHPIGSLLVDPGGPGESGVDFLPGIVGVMPANLLDRFTVVGFDPPGVARSAPVTCGDGAALDAELGVDPGPTTAAGFAALVGADRRFAAGCASRSGAELADVGTLDAARDMDLIRAALGEARLDYLGFSYGTLLGAAYAQLFPTRVRTMVLDAAIDPSLGPLAAARTQSAALDSQLAAFEASCTSGGCGWHPAGSPAEAFTALLARVRAHPVTTGGRSVGAAQMLFGSAAALYAPSTWPTLGAALAALSSGDGGPMLDLYDAYVGRNADGTWSNVVEAETAVDCVDAPAPSLAAIRAAGPGVEAVAPVFGLLDLDGEIPCTMWPVGPSPVPSVLRAEGSPPIVVVGTTHDPVTPYAWAQALAAQLQHGVLLTRRGYGHGAYPYSACIRTVVDRYLETAQPPRPGLSCAT